MIGPIAAGVFAGVAASVLVFVARIAWAVWTVERERKALKR